MTASKLADISASIGYAIGTLAAIQDTMKDDPFKKEAIQKAIDGLRNIKLAEVTAIT